MPPYWSFARFICFACASPQECGGSLLEVPWSCRFGCANIFRISVAGWGTLGYWCRVVRQGGPTEMPPRLLGFPRGMIGRAASFLFSDFFCFSDLGILRESTTQVA